MSMAIASDVDETATGSSGNPVENEDGNMLADSTASNQIDCPVPLYFKNLKDFAFDMPGGWTDGPLRLFIDTFKMYKDDFSRSPPDELKIWQKIVKRCVERSVERSDKIKLFTVNSVMELAGSLKSFILRNEYRKDDDMFKRLYNDVVDILSYFPDTTCDSVSQNLRLRTRTQGAKALLTPDSSSRSQDIDSLILQYCRKTNLGSYCSNNNWSLFSSKILKNHGIKVDVLKYLGSFKRSIIKLLKNETDPEKRKATFYEAVGVYEDYFNLIPPRTAKIEDYDPDYTKPEVDANKTHSEGSDTEQTKTGEEEEKRVTATDGPRVYASRRTTKKVKPGNATLEDFPQIARILSCNGDSYNSGASSNESDYPDFIPPINSSKKLNNQLDHLLNSSSCSSDNLEDTEKKEKEWKDVISEKRHNSESESNPVSKTQSKTKGWKSTASDEGDDESSTRSDSKATKRPHPEPVKAPQTKKIFTSHNNKFVGMPTSTKTNHIFKSRGKVEVSPMTTVRASHAVQSSKRSQESQDSVSNKRSKASYSKSTSEPTGDPSNTLEVELMPELRSAAAVSTSGERVKSKNIVTPINIKMTEQVQQEASTSSESYFKSEQAVQPRSSRVVQDLTRLDRMEENTMRMIEGYKEKVKDVNHSVMQLIPSQHMHKAIPPVGVSSAASSSTVDCTSEYQAQPFTMSKPPGWFESFISDYKKHEMWKMHQLLKMQQELVDMENKKLNVLDKILTSLNDRKS